MQTSSATQFCCLFSRQISGVACLTLKLLIAKSLTVETLQDLAGRADFAAEGRCEPPADDVVLTGVLHRESVPASPGTVHCDRFDPTPPFDFGDKDEYFSGTIRLRCGRLDILDRPRLSESTPTAIGR